MRPYAVLGQIEVYHPRKPMRLFRVGKRSGKVWIFPEKVDSDGWDIKTHTLPKAEGIPPRQFSKVLRALFPKPHSFGLVPGNSPFGWKATSDNIEEYLIERIRGKRSPE